MTQAVHENSTYDVIVVGTGALGLSLGVELSTRGQRVALIGQADSPGTASAAAGAMLGCYGEVTSTSLQSQQGRDKHEMAVQAGALWEGWLARITDRDDGGGLRTADGTCIILNTVGVPGIDDANYAAIRQSLLDHDEAFQDISPADIPLSLIHI